MKYKKNERGREGEKSKKDITSTKDLTIELPEGRESPYQA